MKKCFLFFSLTTTSITFCSSQDNVIKNIALDLMLTAEFDEDLLKELADPQFSLSSTQSTPSSFAKNTADNSSSNEQNVNHKKIIIPAKTTSVEGKMSGMTLVDCLTKKFSNFRYNKKDNVLLFTSSCEKHKYKCDSSQYVKESYNKKKLMAYFGYLKEYIKHHNYETNQREKDFETIAKAKTYIRNNFSILSQNQLSSPPLSAPSELTNQFINPLTNIASLFTNATSSLQPKESLPIKRKAHETEDSGSEENDSSCGKRKTQEKSTFLTEKILKNDFTKSLTEVSTQFSVDKNKKFLFFTCNCITENADHNKTILNRLKETYSLQDLHTFRSNIKKSLNRHYSGHNHTTTPEIKEKNKHQKKQDAKIILKAIRDL